MIKFYDLEIIKYMFDIFELLMFKMMSYFWISVCIFYYYLVWQVELRWLEWIDIFVIRKMVVIFFKYLDLRTVKVNFNQFLLFLQLNVNVDGDRFKGCCFNSD